ncbi:MAG: ABC transporter permease [Spongiibacteraceae bacterium]
MATAEIFTAASVLPADLLQPAPSRTVLEGSVRRSRSYWEQVRVRLARNPRAVFALVIIAVLVLGALIGPLLWRVDPAGQAIGAISRGPMLAQSAQIIVDQAPWRVVVESTAAEPLPIVNAPSLNAPAKNNRELAAPQHLQVVEANTQRVRLRWSPVAGAVRYHIYRHTRVPRDRTDLGLPIGETLLLNQVSYQDGLMLRDRPYWYSVVATLDASESAQESREYATVAAQPTRAIGWLEAQLQGLVPVDADPESWRDKTVVLSGNPLGTDYLGRDLLARVLHGARTSLFIGISAPFLFVAFGVFYGATAGFLGGRVDSVMMRFADFVVALPMLLFMILLRIAFGIGPGESGVLPMVIALVVMSWPASARLVRGQVLQLREEGFVAAARLAGGGNLYIIVRHMLPNVLGVVLVSLTFAIPHAIFTEAFLSFIGMGVTPPTPSWGSMSSDGLRNLFEHPSELFWPALCISLTVFAFNMLGDALRDALDVNEDLAADAGNVP